MRKRKREKKEMNKKMIIKNTILINKLILQTQYLTEMRYMPVDFKLEGEVKIIREDGRNAVMHIKKSEYDNLVKKYGEQEGFNMMDMIVAGLHKRYLFELIVHEAA